VRPLPADFWRDVLEEIEQIDRYSAVDAGIWNVAREIPQPYSTTIAFPYFHRTSDGVQLDTLRFRPPRDDADINVFGICGNATEIHGDIAPTMPRSPYLATDAVPTARAQGEPLYVVEGEIDALSLWRAGRYAVGAPGTSSWRDEWCEEWGELSHVIVIGDGDESGDEFTSDVAESIGRACGARWQSRHVTRKIFNGDDVNDLLQRHGEGWLSEALTDLERHVEQTKTAT
jgi:5S rRNA maturation endonuclease (ribonuclease M5)